MAFSDNPDLLDGIDRGFAIVGSIGMTVDRM